MSSSDVDYKALLNDERYEIETEDPLTGEEIQVITTLANSLRPRHSVSAAREAIAFIQSSGYGEASKLFVKELTYKY
jgi:hypothetical protein